MTDDAGGEEGSGAIDVDPRELDFEDAIGRLEEIVDDLESGRAADADLDLERALALYEEGVGLVRACRDRLEDAEQRLERLDVDGGPTNGDADDGAVEGGGAGGGGAETGTDAGSDADDPGAGPNETLGGPE